MMEPKNILVIGATGQQGGAVARELLAGGHSVKAFTRNPESEKAQALEMLGAEIIQGDLNDAPSLEQAMEGSWGVFSVHTPFEGGVKMEEEQGIHLAETAKRTDVKHLVYSSVASAYRNTGIPHFESKWHIEETIRKLRLPSYTIIRPVFFMENFLSPSFMQGFRQGKLMIGMHPETILQMIALEDIGRYGLWAFENHIELRGHAVDIAGDACTMPDAARIIGSATGKALEFFQVPIKEVRKFSEDYALMLEWFDRVGYDVDIEGMAGESGIRPTSLREWASGIEWAY